MRTDAFTGHETATTVTDDSVTYHQTRVAHYDRSEGVITLDTGGWFTATTKRRMNQALEHWGFGYMWVHGRESARGRTKPGGDWSVNLGRDGFKDFCGESVLLRVAA